MKIPFGARSIESRGRQTSYFILKTPVFIAIRTQQFTNISLLKISLQVKKRCVKDLT